MLNKKISRKAFLRIFSFGFLSVFILPLVKKIETKSGSGGKNISNKEAMYYKNLAG